MRILLSAFTISPKKGSEWGLGWEFARRLSEQHDVTVIYGDLTAVPTSKLEMESWMRDHPADDRMKLIYVPPSSLAVQYASYHVKPGLRSMLYVGYRLWQERVLAVVRQLHQENPFDLVHQLTYATYREPGYLWKLGIPYFWGPFSGGNVIPLRYASVLGMRGTIEAAGRIIVNGLTLITHPRIKHAARAARHVWCTSPREIGIMTRLGAKPTLMLEVGSAPGEYKVRTFRPGQALHVVWSGVHIPRKALPILLQALARLGPDTNICAHVLGARYDHVEVDTQTVQLADELGVSSMVKFYGMLPRTAALDVMNAAHVLVHTSLLEGTSTVLLEALSSGLPVIAHDACGMAAAITEDCGIKIPMKSLDQSIQGFADALVTLMKTPELLERLSQGALKRSEALSWQVKMQQVDEAYRSVQVSQSGRLDGPANA